MTKEATRRTVTITIRVDEPLARAIDAAVEKRQAESPGLTISRSDVIRELLHWTFLAAPSQAAP